MQQTPRGLRLQIGIFGRRNVGKSSILNAITRQRISIVSDVAGTTTDPVEKAMELLPIGPVLFVDTAGIDETSDLGLLRVEKTNKVIDRVDVAILVTDDWQRYEEELYNVFRERKITCIIAANKSDLRTDVSVEDAARRLGAERVLRVSATDGTGISELRDMLIETAPEDFFATTKIIGDLISPGDLVILVTPIDKEAPKGRLILPQVQTLRDLLDNNAMSMVVTEYQLAEAISRLKDPPALVVTDSQAFQKVSEAVPQSVPMTGFSILFSRFKGDLHEYIRGAVSIDRLKPGDRILIAEGCTHHPIGEDIGRIKIPRWLERYVGGEIKFDVYSGQDYPDNLSDYKLVIHCGACVLNRRAVLTRTAKARNAGVPITNYGIAIAYSLGMLERALKPFPGASEVYQEAKKLIIS